MSNSAGLAVPGLSWLGLHASDFNEFAIPEKHMLPLGEREAARAASLRSRECMSMEPLWLYALARAQRQLMSCVRNELREMQARGSKAEIEVLSARGVQFLTEEYLPRKLGDGTWHD